MTEHHIRLLEASQEKAAKRSKTLNELREWLDGKHREALQEDPYGRFVSRIPIGLLANLTPQEREEMDAYERGAFDRHQPVAQAREQQLAAFVRAGGNVQDFEENWERSGRDGYIAAVAGEQLQRVYQDDIFRS